MVLSVNCINTYFVRAASAISLTAADEGRGDWRSTRAILSLSITLLDVLFCKVTEKTLMPKIFFRLNAPARWMSRQNATPASLHGSLPRVGRSSPCCRPVSSRHEFGAVSVGGLPAACPSFFCWYIYSVLVKVVFTLCLLVISAAAIGSGRP